ncbi:cell wall-binding repeat-containing protein [Halobacillus litoralis]|uniref:cell wall-binding repeat-containing protein n=1 Tax=Halobacillus litoralis TaxID=45668 RepID=UPI001CFEEAD6|nr:cell wall-binding repeat-containing protein [Halobacillus litoralis]
MKKTIGFTAAFLLAATLFTSPVLAGSSQEFKNLEEFKKQKQTPNALEVELLGYNDWGAFEEEEPNNTRAQANPITPEDVAIGTFSDDDKDYYKLEINGDKEVDLIVSLFIFEEETTDMELNVNLYDTGGSKVDSYFEDSDEYGYAGGFYVEPGVYYMEASDSANLNNGETYMLSPYIFEDEPYIERIAGKDRYHTSASIAVRRSGGYPSENVVLATGADFPDALAGAPFAFQSDAPILLTTKNSLPKITESTLEVLETDHVTILGGTGAVSKEVENKLKSLGIDVERISGSNRYETAAAIAAEIPFSDGAVIAYGRNFPDALAIAPVAAMNGMPILLTERDYLPSATQKAIRGYDYSYVVGGSGVIAENILTQLPYPERIAGKNRYSTSVAIAKYFSLDPALVNLATGANFADALSGSVYGVGEPLLLTPKDHLDPQVKSYVKENESFYFRIFGGTGAVSEQVEDDIWSLFE